jgi:hypothetical protein
VSPGLIPVTGTKNVVVVITVPLEWRGLPPLAIRSKLQRQPEVMELLAQEVHRWLNTDDLDAATIGQKILDLNRDQGI